MKLQTSLKTLANGHKAIVIEHDCSTKYQAVIPAASPYAEVLPGIVRDAHLKVCPQSGR